jgi:hypothetical protein
MTRGHQPTTLHHTSLEDVYFSEYLTWLHYPVNESDVKHC